MAAANDVNTDKIAVRSQAAYVIDSATGQVLYSKAGDARRAVASTTKVLTAMLVIENSRLQDQVVVGPAIPATGGAIIGLKAGERRSVEELLHALLLVSANDAAAALAEHISGSVPDFARLMNERARELGAKDSSFSVPHGLASVATHYSTASDMALIARAAMKNETFKRLVSTKKHPWDTRSAQGIRELENSNELLTRYGLAVGVKTGFTNESGYCLVGGAQSADREVIAVILGGGTRDDSFDDALKLLDWSLKKFARRDLVRKDRRCAVVKLEGKTVPLSAGSTVEALTFLGDERAVVFRPHLKARVGLPVVKGERVGYLEIVQPGKKSRRTELIAARTVRSSYVERNLEGYIRRVVKKMINLF